MVPRALRAAATFKLFILSMFGVAACVPVTPPDAYKGPLGAWAPFMTPADGTPVMVASSAYGRPIDHGLQVCLTNGPGVPVTVHVWTGDSGFPASTNTRPQLSVGQCVQVDRPVAVVVQSSANTPAFSGYYRWMRPSAVAGPPKIVPLDGAVPSQPPAIAGDGPGARCERLPSPTRQFWSFCDVDLPFLRQAARLCLGPDYLESTDGKTTYATGLLELILSNALKSMNKPSDNDPRWSNVVGGGCRDVFHASDASFMVGPAQTGGFWDPSKVKAIKVFTTALQ